MIVIIIKIRNLFSGFEIFNFFLIKAENSKVITSSMQEKKHADASLHVMEV